MAVSYISWQEGIILGTKYQASNIKQQAPNIKHQAPNIKHGQIQRSIWPSSTRQSCALPFRKCLDLDQNMKSHPQLDVAFWILMSYFGVQVCPITFHAGCFHLLEDITKSLLAKSLHVPRASEIKTFSEPEAKEKTSVHPCNFIYRWWPSLEYHTKRKNDLAGFSTPGLKMYWNVHSLCSFQRHRVSLWGNAIIWPRNATF